MFTGCLIAVFHIGMASDSLGTHGPFAKHTKHSILYGIVLLNTGNSELQNGHGFIFVSDSLIVSSRFVQDKLFAKVLGVGV